MPILTEGTHAGGFLVWEVLRDYTRETITVASGAGKLAAGTVLGKITTGHNGRRLVVDAALEAGGAPVHKLDGALGLDGGNSSVEILGDDITTIHQTARHILIVTRIIWEGQFQEYLIKY